MTNSHQPPKPQKRSRDRLPEFLTQDQVRQLFSVIKSKRDLAIFKVAYRHGLRASEVGMLEKTDVDLKQARITINRLKGSLSGVYPMSADTVKVLRSYLRTRDDDIPFLFISNRGLPIDRRTLLVTMKKYATAAGIPAEKQDFHILKHSICTHLLDAGEELFFVNDRGPQEYPEYSRLCSPDHCHHGRPGQESIRESPGGMTHFDSTHHAHFFEVDAQVLVWADESPIANVRDHPAAHGLSDS